MSPTWFARIENDLIAKGHSGRYAVFDTADESVTVVSTETEAIDMTTTTTAEQNETRRFFRRIGGMVAAEQALKDQYAVYHKAYQAVTTRAEYEAARESLSALSEQYRNAFLQVQTSWPSIRYDHNEVYTDDDIDEQMCSLSNRYSDNAWHIK